MSCVIGLKIGLKLCKNSTCYKFVTYGATVYGQELSSFFLFLKSPSATKLGAPSPNYCFEGGVTCRRCRISIFVGGCGPPARQPSLWPAARPPDRPPRIRLCVPALDFDIWLPNRIVGTRNGMAATYAYRYRQYVPPLLPFK